MAKRRNLGKLILVLSICLLPLNAVAGICTVENDGTQIEAENYTSATSGTYFTDQGSYLTATHQDTSFEPPASENPVGYDLYFPASGSYYIHVYGNSNGDGGENSIWYGVDGDPVGGITFPTSDSNYHWSNDRFSAGPNPPVINIPDAGTHTINFWSREDNFRFGAFLIRKDTSAFPSTITLTDPTDPSNVCVTPGGAVDDDYDGDGFTESDSPPDCNDFDATIYPGATEICGNSTDDDCDGQSDEGCSTVTVVDSGPISQVPLTLVNPARPQLLLNMSKDHQMFLPAYKEYDDLNDDLRPDQTYIHAVKYYGYFDPDKCYDYDATDGRFEPQSLSTDRYCSGNWSGNFLNWAAMSRMDVVRKILYGGYRSTDTSSLTVLERSYIPSDMHSWVKYYNGDDIDQLTPYSSIADSAPTSNSSSSVTIGTGSKSFGHSFTQVQVGDQVTIEAVGLEETDYMEGVVTADGDPMTVNVVRVNPFTVGTTHATWTITNWSRQGISICNTTHATSGFSQAITAPPLMRIASGDYGLWTANENVQCRWDEETSRTNGNIKALSDMNANSRSPVRADVGMANVVSGEQNDYNVRVVACDSSLLGVEKCRLYSNGNYKPVGLLQIYGENESLHFGLMTGSYTKNKSGGVLRKNIGSLLDEIDTTDGTFLTAPAAGAIVETLDLLRIFGYSHSSQNYADSSSSGDNCNFDFSRPPTGAWADGQCTNWGNPQSEIFLESLRYLAGQSASAAYTVSGDDKISGLGSATWNDPLSADTYCSSLNIINFNASIPSFDNDQLSGVTDLNTTDSASTLTDLVGVGENIHGNDWFVGEDGTATSADVEYQICTSKTINSLGDVEGTCPEAPKSDGSFQIAGLAHYAFTNDIRDDLQDDQTVKMYGVEMAAAVPKIVVPMPDDATEIVTILPACRDHRMTPAGSCSIVNFKVIDQNIPAGNGRFYIQWEASASGGDHDQDMGGILSYEVDTAADTITVTTDAVAQSAGMISPFGYTISGTSADGFHAHSGVNGYSYTDSSGVTDCSGGCNVGDAATSATYSVSGASGGLLHSPLYYASKWGGYYKENSALTFPTDQLSWDADSDGLPDNYFYATNPEQLEANLKEVLNSLAEVSSSSAAVASNSTQLQNETVIYQAKFNSSDWSGEFIAVELDSDGSGGITTSTDPWGASGAESHFPVPADRNIFTINPAATSSPYGLEFLWASLTATQQAALDKPTIAAVSSDGLGADRVDYFRGDRTVERSNGGQLRDRSKVLGDIVNSDPIYVGIPDYGFYRLPGTEGTSYNTFRSTNSARTRMVYVGANDGMLHAFDAVNGDEEFAYVPNSLIEHMPRTTLTNYGTQQNGHRYMVDGSARVSDAYFDSAWHTVLLGTTGAGGTTVFALDVTDPGNFSTADVLWEINHETLDGSSNQIFADLGFTIPQPTIGRLNTGQWVAFISNGYHSDEFAGTGKAVLYVVDIATGLPLATGGTIDVGVGDTTDPNGLSAPVPVDNDGDKIVDYVYAGDLKGNLWKFDFTSVTASDWGVAYDDGGSPATLLPVITIEGPSGEVQPITVRPAVGRHPNGTDIMVWFGTGKFFDSNDRALDATPSNRPVMSFYGIQDKGSAIETARTDLVGQSILYEGTVSVTTTDTDGNTTTVELFDGRSVRAISQNSVNYGTGAGADVGWYLDLISPNSPYYFGERIVEQAILDNGKIIFVTLIPSDSPCEPGGTSWLMEADPYSGGRLDTTVFDADGDGDIDDDDKITIQDSSGNDIIVTVTGIESDEGIIQAPKILDDDSDCNPDDETCNQQKVFSGSTGNLMFQKEKGGDQSMKGRQSWRQIR